MNGSFKNSVVLVKFIVRRERVISLIWIALLVFITLAVAPALNTLMTSQSDISEMAAIMENPAMKAMIGPVYGIESYNVGKMFANEMLLFTIITVGIMNIFFVSRHTRKDEEKGRVEVTRSLPVGRLSNLNAALISAAALNVILAVLTGLGLAALGIESMDFNGSMLYGAALGVSGLFFAALTAVFAQLCSNSSGTVGFSFITMAVLYLIRAAGDVNSEVLSLISPMGLILRVQVYHKNDWFPVFILILEAVAIVAVSFALNRIRDVGQGFIPAKPGRKTASVFLKSPLGLALRLTKTTIIGWIIGMFVLGATYGSIMGENSMKSFLEGNEYFQTMLGVTGSEAAEALIRQFIVFILLITALIAVVPVFTIMLRVRKEEVRGRAEGILASAVSRTRYLAGYFGIAVISSAVMLFMGAFGLWLSCAAVTANPMGFNEILKAIMAYLPAILVMLGFLTLIIGILPDKTIMAWIYFGFSFFVVYIGRLMNLPGWVKRLTPFGYIGQYPAEEINALNLLLLSAIFVCASALGFMHYRSRDLMNR